MIGYLTSNHPLVATFRSLPKKRTRADDRIQRKIFKMAPKLSDYFRDGEIVASKGDLDRPISGLAMDSRRVMPGNLFFALPGRRTDGSSFLDEAISRGAVAIVSEKIPTGTAAKVTYIHVTDARQALARVSQRFFDFPDRAVELLGVTGTNGKTTVTSLLKHLISSSTQRVGLIGTINYDLGARIVPSFRTTPEALDLFGMIAQMRDAGCKQAVMEVSSHGIDQQRVRGAARQRLEPDRTRPGIEVENVRAAQRAEPGQQRAEHRLADPVGRRPGAGHRHREPPTARAPSDDPGHVGSAPTRAASQPAISPTSVIVPEATPITNSKASS